MVQNCRSCVKKRKINQAPTYSTTRFVSVALIILSDECVVNRRANRWGLRYAADVHRGAVGELNYSANRFQLEPTNLTVTNVFQCILTLNRVMLLSLHLPTRPSIHPWTFPKLFIQITPCSSVNVTQPRLLSSRLVIYSPGLLANALIQSDLQSMQRRNSHNSQQEIQRQVADWMRAVQEEKVKGNIKMLLLSSHVFPLVNHPSSSFFSPRSLLLFFFLSPVRHPFHTPRCLCASQQSEKSSPPTQNFINQLPRP